MSSISKLKTPVIQLKEINELRKAMKEDLQSFKKKEINEAILKRRQRENKIKLAYKSAPFALSCVVFTMFGSMEMYEAFQSNIPFSEAMGNNFSVFFDTLSNIATESFKNNPLEGKEFLKELTAQPVQVITDYISYITKGAWDFISNSFDKAINTNFLLTVTGAYALTNGVISGLGIATGAASNLEKVRMYDMEHTKLDILRKFHHDPVYDNLNNEELFAMFYSFNDMLAKNNLGKDKKLRKVLEGLEKFDIAIRTFRKAFNTTNNDAPKLMTQVFKFLEDDIDEDNLAKTFLKYGVSPVEFKSVAAEKFGQNGLTATEKKEYIFDVNKRALISAYKRKLKDDMLLSFALKLETLVNVEEKETDKKFLAEFQKFNEFVELYEKNNKIFKGTVLDYSLKEMKKISNALITQNISEIRKVKDNHRNDSYVKILEDLAPHLITRSTEKSVFLNNYSFLSYFEAEKERHSRKDALEQRWRENVEALALADKTTNNVEYKNRQKKIKNIQEELITVNDVFYGQKTLLARKYEKSIKSIFKPQESKVSSIYKDDFAKHVVSVRNILTEKESERLLRGEALKDKGVSFDTAQRVLDIRNAIDSKTKDYNPEISRESFKEREKKYRGDCSQLKKMIKIK